jgi:hypothetical protein
LNELARALLCLGSMLAVGSVCSLVLGVPPLAAASAAFALGAVVFTGPTRTARRRAAIASEASETSMVEALTARLTPARGTLCVCVPTYNEAENVRPFVRALLETFDRAGLDGVVLIVDDASPDGTGMIADSLSAEDERVRVLQRKERSRASLRGSLCVGTRPRIRTHRADGL